MLWGASFLYTEGVLLAAVIRKAVSYIIVLFVTSCSVVTRLKKMKNKIFPMGILFLLERFLICPGGRWSVNILNRHTQRKKTIHGRGGITSLVVLPKVA